MPITNMLTITEAAQQIGVSRQRMHVLIKTYGLQTERAGPIKMIARDELAKLPTNRPSGRKVTNSPC